MTIIVVKDGIMAADSAAFIGAVRVHTARPKITRRRDGALIGCAGTTPIIDAFREWFLNGEGENSKPRITVDEGDLEALILRPDGSAWRVGSLMLPYAVVSPYALGSETAGIVALGAMHAGASAEEAVRITIENTIHVGGDVQVERLHAVV